MTATPPDLTGEQRRQIRQAAKSAYLKLRWSVGDRSELLTELELLARDSFAEGARQERAACAALAEVCDDADSAARFIRARSNVEGKPTPD